MITNCLCPDCVSRQLVEIAEEDLRAGRITDDEYITILDKHFKQMMGDFK